MPPLPLHRRPPTPPRPALHDSAPPGRAPGGFAPLALSCLLLSSLALDPPARAQGDAPAPAASQAVSTERSGFDLLSGDGGNFYPLSHGGILEKTLSVRAGGQPLKLGEDYFVNPAAGHLTLLRPLDPGVSLSVRYRYSPDSDASKKPMGFRFAPGFAGNTKLNLVYSATPGGLSFGGANGSQVTGLALDAQKVGSGQLSGMMFMSRKGSGPFSALRRPREGHAALLSQLVGNEKEEESGSGELQQVNLDGLKAGKATFGLSYRKVGEEFDFAPLAGQYKEGPAKKALDRLQKERGLTTLGFNGQVDLGKDSRTFMRYTQVKDGKGDATQHALGYTSKVADVSYSRLRVAKEFTKLKEADFQNAGDLKPGQDRTDLALALRPSKALNLQSSLTRVKSEDGGDRTVRKNTLELKPGKNTKLSLGKEQVVARLSKEADKTKKEIKQSLILDHQQKGLILRASQENLRLEEPKSVHRQLNQLFRFEAGENKTTVILYERKMAATGEAHKKTNRRMTFSTRITRLCAIQFTETSLRVMEKEKLRTAYEKHLRVETEAKNPVKLAFDKREELKEDGASKAIQQIVFAANVSPTAQLTVQNTTFEQASGDQKVSGQNLEFTAKPSPTVTVSGNFLSREHSEKGPSGETNLKLQTQAGGVDLVAERKTAEAEGEDRDMVETSVAVAASVAEDTKVRGLYLNRKNKGKNERQVRSFGLEGGWLGGRLILELGKTRYLQGQPFTTYAAGFTSSRDPNRPLKFVALYRKMGGADGSQVSEYQYNVDWKVSSRFAFTLKSFQNESVRDGFFYKITPVRGHGFSMDAHLNSRLKLSCGFDNEKDMLKGTIIRTKNLTLKGHLSDATVIDLIYLSRITPKWKEDTPTHWVRLNLKRDLGDEDRLVLTGEAKFWKDSDEKTEDKKHVSARLDYVKAF